MCVRSIGLLQRNTRCYVPEDRSHQHTSRISEYVKVSEQEIRDKFNYYRTENSYVTLLHLKQKHKTHYSALSTYAEFVGTVSEVTQFPLSILTWEA
jgi:hypothetical protein